MDFTLESPLTTHQQSPERFLRMKMTFFAKCERRKNVCEWSTFQQSLEIVHATSSNADGRFLYQLIFDVFIKIRAFFESADSHP